jgi:hypothetical protein
MKGTFSSVVLLTTTGCLTKKFSESHYASGKYHDTIFSFLITEDGSKVVVLGEKYHYIFDATPGLKRILLGSFRPKIYADFSNLHVTLDNKITLDYKLYFVEPASDDDKKSAIDAGFVADDNSNLTFSGHLEGVRYRTDGFPSIAHKYMFNYPYIVEITEDQSIPNKAGKILITPIVVLADGVLILAGIALIILAGGCAGCR